MSTNPTRNKDWESTRDGQWQMLSWDMFEGEKREENQLLGRSGIVSGTPVSLDLNAPIL